MDLFIAHFVRHDEDGLVAFEGRGDRQPHTRVAAGGLDHGPSWF